jgi:hypothetical protein
VNFLKLWYCIPKKYHSSNWSSAHLLSMCSLIFLNKMYVQSIWNVYKFNPGPVHVALMRQNSAAPRHDSFPTDHDVCVLHVTSRKLKPKTANRPNLPYKRPSRNPSQRPQEWTSPVISQGDCQNKHQLSQAKLISRVPNTIDSPSGKPSTSGSHLCCLFSLASPCQWTFVRVIYKILAEPNQRLTVVYTCYMSKHSEFPTDLFQLQLTSACGGIVGLLGTLLDGTKSCGYRSVKE